MGKATVVLVDRTSGGELAAVRDALSALNTPAIILQHHDFETVPLGLDVGTGLLHVDGEAVRPAVVWVRHSSGCALQAGARTGPLRAAAWSGFLAQLAESAGARLPGTAPTGTGQVAGAARLGVRTPRTVVTNGGCRLPEGKLIVKTPDFRLYEPDREKWASCLPAVSHDPPGGLREWPAVVQEYVEHARELRVYHMNGGICAFEVRKPEPSSLWTDPATVTVARVDCPEPAEKVVRTLCAAWGLRYGAFDLLVTAAGEPVFLEANADGDWLWYERKARWHGVSFMAAVMVRELFVSTVVGSSRR